MRVVARRIVVDTIAIAHIEAIHGAIPPDRALHEPRKRRREGRVELSSINVGRELIYDASAPSRLIATGSVRVVGTKPPQDPGSVQEIMDEGVDGDERRADFEPQRLSVPGAQQQARHCYRQHLVSHAVDVPEWRDDGLAQGCEPIRRMGIHTIQLFIDPAHEIVIRNIPHEQEQAVCHLVQSAVPQRVAGQQAGIDVAGLSTGVRSLLVSAVVEPPVPAELRTRWASRQRFGDSDHRTVPCWAM